MLVVVEFVIETDDPESLIDWAKKYPLKNMDTEWKRQNHMRRSETLVHIDARELCSLTEASDVPTID